MNAAHANKVTPTPKCIIVTGRPGSGKTTLARKLSQLVHMPMLSRDEMKEGLVSTFGVSHEELAPDTNRKITSAFFSIVRTVLQAHVSLVVEAAFQHNLWSDAVAAWSNDGELCFIICEAEAMLCAQRHLDRGLQDPTREFYHGDKRVKVFRQTGEFLPPGEYAPPSFDLPTLSVRTADGYTPDLPAIKNFIQKTVDHAGQ